MHNKKFSKVFKLLIIVIALAAVLLVVYFISPVSDRSAWQFANLHGGINIFKDPKETVSPGDQTEIAAYFNVTPTQMTTEATTTFTPSLTLTKLITATLTETPAPSQTLTPTPTPLPEAVFLEGIVFEYQDMNNCGPAALSMALSYWGWQGDQYDTEFWLKGHPDDHNVMPEELIAFIRQETAFNAILRWGGDIEMIKKFNAANFPVIIERDMADIRPHENWTGHYGVVRGYDNVTGSVTLADSFSSPNYRLPYENLEKYWRAFNYAYIIIFPPEQEADVLSILGPHADETYNHEFAAQKAQHEIKILEGRDLFFAWFNYGTSLVNLGDYDEASMAYDHAYEEVFTLIPGRDKPWRMLWYQTGPYHAYYHTGRYQDIIDLAEITLTNAVDDEIEETWYWLGRAKLAKGDESGAIEDFRKALIYRPGWVAVEMALESLGVEP